MFPGDWYYYVCYHRNLAEEWEGDGDGSEGFDNIGKN